MRCYVREILTYTSKYKTAIKRIEIHAMSRHSMVESACDSVGSGSGDICVESGSGCEGGAGRSLSSASGSAAGSSPSPAQPYAATSASCSRTRARFTLSSCRLTSSLVIVTDAISGCSGFKKTPGFSSIACFAPVWPGMIISHLYFNKLSCIFFK